MLHAFLVLNSALIMLAGQPALHKFYVSNTIIEFNPRTQMFEVTSKIFTDDLERGLEKMGAMKVDLSTGSDKTKYDSLIDRYVSKHLRLFINDQPVMLRYVGFESEVDLTYCYFEVTSHTDFHSLRIENDLLMEVYSEQKNIVDVRKDGFTRTLILLKDRITETIVK